MATKRWVSVALQCLGESLRPLPHEVNELDWKAQLSDHKDRLAEHLMAFANHRSGGTLVFGVDNAGVPMGVDAAVVAQTATRWPTWDAMPSSRRWPSTTRRWTTKAARCCWCTCPSRL
ncbi:MAG: ATP-binding protein [Rubrivivax sp.]